VTVREALPEVRVARIARQYIAPLRLMRADPHRIRVDANQRVSVGPAHLVVGTRAYTPHADDGNRRSARVDQTIVPHARVSLQSQPQRPESPVQSVRLRIGHRRHCDSMHWHSLQLTILRVPKRHSGFPKYATARALTTTRRS